MFVKGMNGTGIQHPTLLPGIPLTIIPLTKSRPAYGDGRLRSAMIT
jgi:hypothetical protein